MAIDGLNYKMVLGVDLTNTDTRNTQKTTFINNTNQSQIGGETVKEKQSLSKALRPKADN